MTRNDLIMECKSYYVIIVHCFFAWHLKINLVAILRVYIYATCIERLPGPAGHHAVSYELFFGS